MSFVLLLILGLSLNAADAGANTPKEILDGIQAQVLNPVIQADYSTLNQ